MAEVLPALDVIAREVEHERAAHLRHTDAVDAKAGLALGFSGVLVAVPATRLEPALVPGVVLAFVAGVMALAVLLPQRQLGRKVALLRIAIVMLVSATAALTAGSIVILGG